MKQSKWNKKKKKELIHWALDIRSWAYGGWWIKKQNEMGFKKKRENGKKKKNKNKKNKKWQKRGGVAAIVRRVFSPKIWSAVWTVERCPFRLKF